MLFTNNTDHQSENYVHKISFLYSHKTLCIANCNYSVYKNGSKENGFSSFITSYEWAI